MPNFTLLGSLEVPYYYYPGWVGVEIIRIKAVLSSTGLGLELELSLAKESCVILGYNGDCRCFSCALVVGDVLQYNSVQEILSDNPILVKGGS